MGKAAEIAREEQADDYLKAGELRGIVLAELDRLSDWSVNPNLQCPTPEIQNTRSKIQNRQSPFILSLSFLDLQGETIVLEMDRAGYAISAGAACSSRSTEPSNVLTALNLQPAWLRGTIRVSFGRFNTKDETAIFAKMLRTTVENLRTL
jgi:cysteine sulfinate desulfinase/cysteine desulfurase-like protein